MSKEGVVTLVLTSEEAAQLFFAAICGYAEYVDDCPVIESALNKLEALIKGE